MPSTRIAETVAGRGPRPIPPRRRPVASPAKSPPRRAGGVFSFARARARTCAARGPDTSEVPAVDLFGSPELSVLARSDGGGLERGRRPDRRKRPDRLRDGRRGSPTALLSRPRAALPPRRGRPSASAEGCDEAGSFVAADFPPRAGARREKAPVRTCSRDRAARRSSRGAATVPRALDATRGSGRSFAGASAGPPPREASRGTAPR